MTRRAFIASLAAAAPGLMGGYALTVGPRWLEVTPHTLGDDTTGRQLLSFVQLTDLHLPSRLGYLEEQVAETVHQLAPDFIVLTGDAVDAHGRLDVLADLLSLLPGGTPVYATLGNWEHWGNVDLAALHGIYEQAGGRLLINETAAVRKGSQRLLLTGLDDATAGRPDLARALAGTQPAAHHLVLAHSPLYRDRIHDAKRSAGLGDYSFSTMLSGHTHGGQVDLFGYKPFLPRGTGRYVEGWFKGARPHLYVSRGIGTSVLPIRFGARPELACFTVYAE